MTHLCVSLEEGLALPNIGPGISVDFFPWSSVPAPISFLTPGASSKDERYRPTRLSEPGAKNPGEKDEENVGDEGEGDEKGVAFV